MYKFPTPLIRGKLICRYKRFLADIELDSGETVTAHCPNTGAMTSCADLGAIVYLSSSDNPKRKLRYTWELSSDADGHLICVNTNLANKLVKNILLDKQLSEIAEYEHVKPEYKFLDSRIDFALGNKLQGEKVETFHTLIEVKSVTLVRDNILLFPDAITTRGTKHCKTLITASREGSDTYLLYCVMRNGKNTFSLASDVDKKYAAAVKTAMGEKVKIIVLFTDISTTDIKVSNYILID